MSTTTQGSELSRDLMPRTRRFGVPSLALRRRSADHPMAMFFMIVATTFAAAAFMAPTDPAFASLGSASTSIVGHAGVTAKTARLPMSETEFACRGQAWGAETEECLTVIARESGRAEARKVRLIAAAEPQGTTPNIF